MNADKLKELRIAEIGFRIVMKLKQLTTRKSPFSEIANFNRNHNSAFRNAKSAFLFNYIATLNQQNKE